MTIHTDHVDYKWTSKDQLVAQARAPGTFVTPYLLPPGSVPDSRSISIGALVSVPLALSGMPWSVNRFYVEGFSWQKIPPAITDYKTIEELCNKLFESDPRKYAFYDLSKKNPGQKNNLALMLFDFWGNTEWRWATVEGSFDWTTLQHAAGTISTSKGDKQIAYALLPRPRISKPIHAAPHADSSSSEQLFAILAMPKAIPPWLDELMGLLRDLGKASGFHRSIGLAQMNDSYMRVIEECSKEYFHVQGMRGLLELMLDHPGAYSMEFLDAPNDEPNESASRRAAGLKHLLGPVTRLEEDVKRRFTTDPDETVKLVGTWARDGRLQYTNYVREIISNPLLTQRLKQLVAEQSKPDSSGAWANDYLECACIILEHAYCALLLSPYPEEAAAHVETMVDKIASKPVDPALIALVEDARFDLQATSDPGDFNPLSVVAGVIGTESGARLQHAVGMAASITQLSIFTRFPSAVKSKKIGSSLASRFFRSMIALADAKRKGLSLIDARIESMGLIAGVNGRDGRRLTILQNRLAGLSWGRWCKTGLAFLGLYFAADKLGSSSGQSSRDDVKDWLDFGSASIGTINSLNKILGTWGMFAAETGVFVGVALGGAATLMAMFSSAIDSYGRGARGDALGAVLAGAGAIAAPAGFAAFVAFEFYGSVLGPPGMAGAALVAVGASVVNSVRDAMVPGPERVFTAFVKRMMADGHCFMLDAVVKSDLEVLASFDLSGIFFDIEIHSPYTIRENPKYDYEKRLLDLGFDRACLSVMCRFPTLYDINEDARAHGVDPLALPAKQSPGAKARPR